MGGETGVGGEEEGVVETAEGVDVEVEGDGGGGVEGDDWVGKLRMRLAWTRRRWEGKEEIEGFTDGRIGLFDDLYGSKM